MPRAVIRLRIRPHGHAEIRHRLEVLTKTDEGETHEDMWRFCLVFRLWNSLVSQVDHYRLIVLFSLVSQSLLWGFIHLHQPLVWIHDWKSLWYSKFHSYCIDYVAFFATSPMLWTMRQTDDMIHLVASNPTGAWWVHLRSKPIRYRFEILKDDFKNCIKI
jgi:hypothetical protein